MITKLFPIFICFLILGCSSAKHNPNIFNETVMTDGMKITAINSYGTLIIEAGKNYRRSYTWDGGTRTALLIPRKKRWGGKFGIYSDANWKANGRIDRGVLEEAQIHTVSLEEAVSFLKHRSRKGHTVYRNDGLAVSWRKAIKPTDGSGSALIVDVWQIFINGKKPQSIPGSQNENITVSYLLRPK